MTLAGMYQGSVVVGLNRGKIDNTIAAASIAVQEIPTLLAIELGTSQNVSPLTYFPFSSPLLSTNLANTS